MTEQSYRNKPRGKVKPNRLPVKWEPGFIQRMDGRDRLVRALQASYDRICEDLGGTDSMSYLKLCVVERCVFMEYVCREMELQVLDGKLKPEDLGRWTQVINSLLGLARTLGLERKDIPAVDLRTYVEERKE